MATGRGILLADADVLIDYRDADLTVLRLASRHIGPIQVLRPVLTEVRNLSESKCARYDVRVIGPSTAELLVAGRQHPDLSFADALCLVVAGRRQFTCLTNDGLLGRVCRGEGVPVRRGLSLMVDLVAARVLAADHALEVALMIRDANPRYITHEVLRAFRDGTGLKG